MINEAILKSEIKGFKKDFSQRWNGDGKYEQLGNVKYKWEAVKWFQDNWDINASNFSKMFAEATKKTGNLLNNQRTYPIDVIIKWSEKDPKLIKQMFKNLFDNSENLLLRIDRFMELVKKCHNKFKGGKNHFQNTNVVSTYLWLRYPNKYYIYKYNYASVVANTLKYPYVPKKKSFNLIEMLKAFDMYTKMTNVIKNDIELVNLMKSFLTKTCYHDSKLTILTQDVGFYIWQKNNKK